MTFVISLLLLSVAPDPVVMSHHEVPKDVIVETRGQCRGSEYRFAYFRNAAFDKNGGPARSTVVKLSVDGKSLPERERVKLNVWLDNQSIETATLFKCGDQENPRAAVAVRFQERSAGQRKNAIRVFYIHADKVEIEHN